MNAQPTIDNIKLFNLVEYINKHTEENRASTLALMEMFSVSERQLRSLVAHARREFHSSIAAHPEGGYFRANNWQQYQRTFRQRINQAIAEIQTQNAVRKSLMTDVHPTLFDQASYSTEYDDVIEFVEQFIFKNQITESLTKKMFDRPSESDQ